MIPFNFNTVLMITIYYQLKTVGSASIQVERPPYSALRRARDAGTAIELQDFISFRVITCPHGEIVHFINTAAHIIDTDDCRGNEFVISWDNNDSGRSKNLKKCTHTPCLCIDPTKIYPDIPRAIKVFSLLEANSDVDDNKVVTGLRFLLDHRVIHLQIQQAKLFENGTVDNEKSWKDVVKFREIKNSSFITFRELTDGVNYQKFSFNIRTMFLDEIVLPDQYVVTGVRLAKTGMLDELNGVKLSVRGTKYDPTFNLLSGTNRWFDWRDMIGKISSYRRDRHEINLGNSPVYTSDGFPGLDPEVKLKNIDITDTNYYIRFRASHDITSACAMLYKPLISTDPAEINHNSPLQGVSLSYHGSDPDESYIIVKIFQSRISITPPGESSTEPPITLDPRLKRRRKPNQDVFCGTKFNSTYDKIAALQFGELIVPSFRGNNFASIIYCQVIIIIISLAFIILF